MIQKLVRILCAPIPHQRLRRAARKQVNQYLTDKMVDMGKVFHSNSLAISEFAPMNQLIDEDSKILIVAPHPDDESIGCGGFMTKYAKQIDCICVSSSGYLRPEDYPKTAEQIADERIAEFNNAMDYYGVRHRWIVKIFGEPPYFDEMMAHADTILSMVNFREYTHIFVPCRFDAHREHQYVTKHLIPLLLRKQGFNKNAIVVYYPVWGTTTLPNYFEDISDIQYRKTEAILLYKSRTEKQDNYAVRVQGLNYWYGMLKFVKYAEAFRCESIETYLSYVDDRNWARFF